MVALLRGEAGNLLAMLGINVPERLCSGGELVDFLLSLCGLHVKFDSYPIILKFSHKSGMYIRFPAKLAHAKYMKKDKKSAPFFHKSEAHV